MANELKAGGLDDFGSSMAQAMEQALNTILVAEGKPPLDTSDTAEVRDRRTLFVAIAQGVVNHLVANHDAFDVTENDGTTALGNHRVVIRKE